ncbi:hypothetical protein DSL72_001106 [Monilinia vaccinii-corymbosi]|uniref:RNA ligase domain-containing protein n=1 Tax=Monilinia vaccinii-corymbosi TaxID=61207 RepID=A0A8A3P9X4_9HELO|nr:hypothetical protein DSL72_001106 [Monilinia vaccinii-corymbosi]
MATPSKTLYPKISGKPKNLLLEFSKYQNKSKGRRATTISVTGRVKLHGTHTDFLIHASNVIQLQSRNHEHLTADKDTIGFVPFAMAVQPEILELKKRIHGRFLKLNPKAQLNDEHPLIVAGEFIGPRIQKDVAIGALPDKCFVIISISINDEWQPDEQYADIHHEPSGIFNVSRGGSFHETIVLQNPDPAFAKMQALSDAVEEECPFAKSFGIIGLGEGIVWKPAAPLCHDAKYWLKLKGPISMGTALAGPARMSQRSTFVTPIFSNPVFSPAIASKAVASRPMSTVISQRSGLVAPIFSTSTPAATGSRFFPNRPPVSTMQSQSLALRPSSSASNLAPNPVSKPIPSATKKVAIWNSENAKSTQSIPSTAQPPRKTDEISPGNAQPIRGERSALMPKKVDEGRLQNLKNIEQSRPMLLGTKKVKEVTKGMSSTKSISLTPEMIQQAKLEILSLIRSNSPPKASSPVLRNVDGATIEAVKLNGSVNTTPGISDVIGHRLIENEDKQQSKSSMQSLSQEADSTPPESTKLGLSPPPPLWKLEEVVSENAQSVVFDDAGAGSLGTRKPVHLPSILESSEEPGVPAARAFANEVVRERRLEQGWQYLGEMLVPTDTKGVETFLKWLWHDVAVEERAEIEELEINKGLLKKEIHKIGRDWYFEELAFEEQTANFGVGAAI